MAFLYIDQSGLELREEGSAIRIYKNGEFQRSLPIKLLDRIVIQGNVTLNTKLIEKVLSHGSSITLLSRRKSDRVAMVMGKPHNDARIRLAQYQWVGDPEKTYRLSLLIVRYKIRKQLALLKRAKSQRLDQRKTLVDATRQLRKALHSLSLTNTRPSDLDQLRGVEGAAARAFFQGYMKLFPPSLKFTNRNRRPPLDPVNSMLSLGYTMLHNEAVKGAYSAGFDPYLGCYHQVSYARESLACDLVELFRSDVDEWVWEMFRTRKIREEHFSMDKGASLLGKAGRGIFFSEWQLFIAPHQKRLRRWLQRFAGRLKESFKDNDLEREDLEIADWE